MGHLTTINIYSYKHFRLFTLFVPWLRYNSMVICVIILQILGYKNIRLPFFHEILF